MEAERPADSVVPIPPSEPLEPEAAAEQMNAVAQAHGDDPSAYIERVMYQPPDPDWKQKEEALLQVAAALYLYWVLRIRGQAPRLWFWSSRASCLVYSYVLRVRVSVKLAAVSFMLFSRVLRSLLVLRRHPL